MAQLIKVGFDLESFWSKDHTLTSMNPIAYCVHPETEIICAAIKVGDDSSIVIAGEENIKKWCAEFDWSDKLVYGHNMAGFDAMILRWRLGVKPAMWGCTLAMARPHHALTTGCSLAKLVKHYGIGVKDNAALMATKGRHLCDFTPQEVEAMMEYNKDDTDQCAALFDILLKKTPKYEMKLIDATIRMLVEPKFRVDTLLLKGALEVEKTRKKELLENMAYDMGWESDMEAPADTYVREKLSSSAKFATYLESLNVPVPMKASPSDPEKQIPALSKTDEDFLALLEYEDDFDEKRAKKVQLAAAARLDVKSTILESRIESFLEVAACTGNRMPIPLNYYAAHTGRWGGAFKLNLQNLPRILKEARSTDVLRYSLKAPANHKIVVADLSGIELRVNHFLWKVPSSVELFQADPEKADLYKEFASELYGVERDAVSKDQRQVGKVAHLGLGFGAGAATFQKVAKTMAGIDLTLDEAQEIVNSWRGAYPEIVKGWRTCHNSLDSIHQGARTEIDPWGMCYTSEEGIHTPKGVIRYPHLRSELNEKGKQEWFYGEGRNKTRIYAGKVTENIVQHLARCALADNMLEIKRQTGLYPAHTVHDELIYIAPAEGAAALLGTVQSVMRTPPTWWPELVTWSEGDVADTYGDAK
jgi:hypothetical protein